MFAEGSTVGDLGAAAPNNPASAMRRAQSPSDAAVGIDTGAGPNQRHPQYASTHASSASDTSHAAPESNFHRHDKARGLFDVTYNSASLTTVVSNVESAACAIAALPVRAAARAFRRCPSQCGAPANQPLHR